VRSFIFLAAAKNTLSFLQHAGKMNTGKKHFGPTLGNGVAGIREVFKGGLGGLPLAHDFATQSLVCYTFCDR
jgi:hypothetical protein